MAMLAIILEVAYVIMTFHHRNEHYYEQRLHHIRSESFYPRMDCMMQTTTFYAYLIDQQTYVSISKAVSCQKEGHSVANISISMSLKLKTRIAHTWGFSRKGIVTIV